MAAPAPPPPGDGPIMVIDIGGTNVKFGFVDASGPHLYGRLFATERLRAGDPVAVLAGFVSAAAGDTGLTPSAIVATVPGFVDADFDRVLSAANVPSLNGRALASELGSAVGCPVYLERDAVLALAGEIAAGCARGADHVLGIFFGTGIGAAYVSGGAPFRGGGWALEIGHMPFRGEGRRLEGLRTDAIEAYCSGRVLRDLAARHGIEVADVFSATGRTGALAAELADFVRDQAFAVATAVALFSPATVVLGGGVLDMDGYPRDRLLALIDAHAPAAETGRRLDVRWSEHGWLSALHGARRVLAERSRPPTAAAPDEMPEGRPSGA